MYLNTVTLGGLDTHCPGHTHVKTPNMCNTMKYIKYASAHLCV